MSDFLYYLAPYAACVVGGMGLGVFLVLLIAAWMPDPNVREKTSNDG